MRWIPYFPPFAVREILKPWWFAGQVADQKASRRRLNSLRERLDPRAAHYHSLNLASRLRALPELQHARVIAAYASLPLEVNTTDLLQSLLHRPLQVVLPRVEGDHLQFYAIQDVNRDFAPGAYGIREPVPERCRPMEPEQVDLFLVPGVGFDLFGGRIGRGAGFYDRVLSRRREDAVLIGMAYEFQIIHTLAASERDVPMHLVVTEEQVYQPRFSCIDCPSAEATRALAAWPVEEGIPAGVVALHGDLGVGKTEWVKGLAAACGVEADVSSPTFVFCHVYPGRETIHHLDGYRLGPGRQEEEDYWSELISEPGWVVIEWAERWGALLPKSAVHLAAAIESGDARRWMLFTPLRDQAIWHKE